MCWHSVEWVVTVDDLGEYSFYFVDIVHSLEQNLERNIECWATNSPWLALKLSWSPQHVPLCGHHDKLRGVFYECSCLLLPPMHHLCTKPRLLAVVGGICFSSFPFADGTFSAVNVCFHPAWPSLLPLQTGRLAGPLSAHYHRIHHHGLVSLIRRPLGCEFLVYVLTGN